jgi:ATP-binding cassette subfamily F protein uup
MISIRELSIRYHGPPLLDEISCEIQTGDRIGLLGRNGSGKSTLLKILAGVATPDSGQLITLPSTKIALLDQEVPTKLVGTIREVVLQASRMSAENGQEDLREGTQEQWQEGWQWENDVDQIISRMDLNPEDRFERLSSGMKRRVLLARALAVKPDFLLLDEPTNHLDIDAIVWLEQFLQRNVASFMFVTHDRMFLRSMANRIWELDRGRLFDWSCDYDTFLIRKEQALAIEEKENALFDKRLAEEEAWIRQGIKARRTRNEGRVRALKEMRVARSQRRDRLGTAKLQIQEGQKSGNLVIALDEVSYQIQDRKIIDRFSTVIMRGDKVGIIGPNGAGKSTLLKLMLGQLHPTAGTVRQGTNLQIAYFDQLREQLDPEATVQENVGEGNDVIQLAEGKKHILGYLQDFLFTAQRARTQVKFLSGGERNRILLAKLFAKPANLIVMDEPTNDLDAETLELLEDRIVGFSGTVLVVSHDRAFLNQVVSSTIVFEPGGLFEYVGGYNDWLRQFQQKSPAEPDRSARNLAGSGPAKLPASPDGRTGGESGPQQASSATFSAGGSQKKRKLKYKEQMELAELPTLIEQLEAEIEQWNARVCDPEFYRKSKSEITEVQQALAAKQAALEQAFARWEELEQLNDA